MALLKTAALAVLFGSLYTLFRKYQSVIQISPGTQQFNQPILQSFIIFVGMSTIIMFRPWMKGDTTAEESKLPSDNKFIYIMPSLLDVLGTIVDTSGLYYTSVSVSQMLKGSVLFFTYVITLFYLKKTLSFRKHIYMLVILLSLIMIGASNISSNSQSKYQSKPLLGNILIIVSQLLFSLMFVYEQKILKKYTVRVQNAVFWEGIWGALLSGLVLAVVSIVKTPISSKVVESCVLICNNSDLLLAVVLTALCIGPFNYFGISLTKEGSALQRCMICTSRMIVVWTFSLIFGWQEFRFLQLIGYAVLTYSIYQFNKEDIKFVQNAELNFDQQSRLRVADEKSEHELHA